MSWEALGERLGSGSPILPIALNDPLTVGNLYGFLWSLLIGHGGKVKPKSMGQSDGRGGEGRGKIVDFCDVH